MKTYLVTVNARRTVEISAASECDAAELANEGSGYVTDPEWYAPVARPSSWMLLHRSGLRLRYEVTEVEPAAVAA